MLRALARRALAGFAVVVGVLALTFVLLHAAPGDPVERLLGPTATPEQIAAQYGIPLPLVQQVVRLIERSEYKRQQAAPVLKVTSKSFGMGRRFPIAVKVQV